MKAIRWGDNDRYFGPFTWSVSPSYKRLAFSLHSGGHGDDNNGPPSARLSVGKYSLIAALPFMIPPQRKKVYPQGWDQDGTAARLGRNWYYDVQPREYGFSYSDGFLLVHYGINPCDSSRDQTWGKHLPWTQWRHVRHSFYGLNGEHIATAPKSVSYKLDGGQSWKIARDLQDATPTVAFSFRDFDDEELTATTRIEEREWHFGTGWFKWLSLFRKPKIRRSLDITFSGEVGPEKGSWKGGTIGTGIEMLPGEDHEAAFRRYCDDDHRSKYRKYRIKFIGRKEPETMH